MTELPLPPLTPEEQILLAQGGRLLLVEEIAGPLWRVLLLTQHECRVLLKPEGADGYTASMDAMLNALAFANLAQTPPHVRPWRYTYEVELVSPAQGGAAWQLRLLEHGEEQGRQEYLLADDSEQAYYAAYLAAMQAGESWRRSFGTE
jgi:hypothetical protein